MLGTRSIAKLSVVLCVLVASICTAAVCQGLGPEMFGIPSYFGMAAPTPTRQLGMGAVMSCVNGEPFANPAFAPIRERSAAGVRMNTTGFDRGPSARSWMGYYSHPIRANESGLQVIGLKLDSSAAWMMLPQVGPVTTKMSEDAWLVDYGRRLNGRLTAGLSIVGNQKSGLSITSPVAGSVLDLSATAGLGARAGAAYEWRPGDYVGLVYGYVQEDVTVSGRAVRSPGRFAFHSNLWAAGASHRFSPELLGAVEFQRGAAWRSPWSRGTNHWHFGAEYQPSPQWAVQAGVAGGSPTFGLGFGDGRWQANYAFIRDWHDHAVGALFGGSKTHSLQVSCEW